MAGMASEAGDDGVNAFAASSVSISGNSPHRRLDSDTNEPSQPRLSPVLARSFDPHDPEVQERQRTMDVDMAMHLQRARRDLSMPSGAAPFDTSIQSGDHQVLSPLSLDEQHHLDIAKGEASDGGDDVSPPLIRKPSFDLHDHVAQAHNPSLLVPLGQPRMHADVEDPSSPVFGLPRYQANAPRTAFDFSHMEQFATDERARLGISLQPKPSTTVITTEVPPPPTWADGTYDLLSPPARTPSRKLSQNIPVSRAHRKGVGGKVALFEGNLGAPTPALTSFGGQVTLPSLSNIDAADSTQIPASTGGMGILQSGHDRSYRFIFYSNASSGVIHARSLSELPAEGQSFLDLFTCPFRNEIVPDTKRLSSAPASKVDLAANGTENSRRSGHSNETSMSERRRDSNRSDLNRKSDAADQPRNVVKGEAVRVADDPESNTWWLDVLSPTDEEMKMLSKVFSIHPLTTEDIQMEETREKIELFRNYYFVCFRGFDQDPYSPTHLEPLNMYIIVFREGTLSFHFRPTPHPQNVRRRIKQLKDYISVTSDWISYALIDDITDAFGPLIQSIEYEVDTIDELVLIIKGAEQSDMLRRIGTCRKKVMGLLRLMGNKADVVKGLAKRCNENWKVAPTSDVGLYLSDIQDHLITMTQNLNHYEKILSRSHSNYLAQISVEMTDANNQINDVLSKLTALGTVLIPMNLVTGLWGMNVHVPGQFDPSYRWFISIIAVLAAFAMVGGYSTYKFMVKRSS